MATLVPPAGDLAALGVDLARLMAPGVLGNFDFIEVTEIVAFPKKGAPPSNLFTIAVAEAGTPAFPFAPATRKLSPKLLHISSLKGWAFGLFRYSVTPADLVQAVARLAMGLDWSLSGKPLQTHGLVAVPRRFAPADGAVVQPWNGILKNNFWGGSHIFELASADEGVLAAMFQDPRRLQELSEVLRPFVPIQIARASDRLGNILIQLPVTAVVARQSRDPSTGLYRIDLSWQNGIPPRPLRFLSDRHFDGMHVATASFITGSGRRTFALPDGRGLETGLLWDKRYDVILWAQTPASRISRFENNIYLDAGIRRFSEPGDPDPRTVQLKALASRQTIGPGPGVNTDERAQRRIYQEERATLRRQRRFVQYMSSGATSESRHEAALDDLRNLIATYGEGGAWLWDPYLGATDILKTLFHCPFAGADLRALSDALTVPKPAPPKGRWARFIDCLRPKPSVKGAGFAEQERQVLDGHSGDATGLRLEFRARIGPGGWSFHDRFLIFPQTSQGPLAWSLGTSVNMLGHKHHILQRVDDGRLVADAFEDLWDELTHPRQLVWKCP